MKNTFNYLFISLAAIALLACTKGEKANTEEATSEPAKDVSELSIMDLYDQVYADSNGVAVEWHGQTMPNDLTDSLMISEGEACGTEGCGKQLLLTNKSDRAIGVLTKADFSIRDRQAYLAREYVIEGGQTMGIGCSHLCYNGESFAFDRTIVGSWYMDE